MTVNDYILFGSYETQTHLDSAISKQNCWAKEQSSLFDCEI